MTRTTGRPDPAQVWPASGRMLTADTPESRFGIGAVSLDDGEFVATMDLGPWARGPAGEPSVGGLGVLVDDVLGVAVWAAGSAERRSVTAELSLDVAAAPAWPGPRLTARARAVSLDTTGGLARCEVRDGAGDLVGIGTARCHYIHAVRTRPPLAQAEATRPRGDAPPVAPRQCTHDRVPGADVVTTINSRIERAGDVARLVMASSRALCNDNGTVHGGILLCAAETAAAGLADPSHREWTSSLRINYLRPLPPDDEVTFTAEIVHRGRSIAVYQVTGRGSAGRPAVVMMVTRTRQATETAGPGAAGLIDRPPSTGGRTG